MHTARPEFPPRLHTHRHAPSHAPQVRATADLSAFARGLRRPSVPRVSPSPAPLVTRLDEKTTLGGGIDFWRKDDNDPPPDGGRDAWLVVLASWLVHFVVFGIMYSWGIWQSYYSTVLPSNPSQISLIGTTSFASIFLFGIPAGRLAECIGFRRAVLCGTACMILGLVLASLSTHHWQLMLTQGVLVGLGSSLIYYPSVSIPAQWWRDRRSFATGVAASGAGVGSVAFTALTDALLGGGLGHRSTLLALAVVSLSMLVLAVELMKTRLAKPPKRPFGEMMRSAVDLEVLRNRQFGPLMVAVFFNAFGSLIPFYFLPSYTTYLSLPASLGPLLLTTANIASTLGRILLGLLADSLGNLNSLLLTLLLQSAACLGLWLWLPTPAGLVAFAALFGFMSGGYISLMPSVTAQICGVSKLRARSVGLVFSGMMVGHLVGPPVAAGMVAEASWWVGWVGGMPAGRYAPMVLFAGMASGIAAVVVGYLRAWVVGGAVWERR